MSRRKIYSCSWIFIFLLFSSTCLYAGWNGFSYVHDEPLSGTQTNTGTLFQLTIAPPAGYEFVTASGYNGAAQEATSLKQRREYSSIHPMLVEIKKLFEEKNFQQAGKQQQEVFCVIDNYLPEEERSFRRLNTYTIPLSLLRQKDMIKEDRIRILNYSLRGFSDSKISHNDKNRLSRSIMRYISKNDIDAENQKLISFALQNKAADNRYFAELVYMAHTEGSNEYIEQLSSKKISSKNIDVIKESGTWGAKLILARTIKGKKIDDVLQVILNIDEEWERNILLEDLEDIKDEKIIFFLMPILNSNKRMPQLKPTLPGELYARRAALVLKKCWSAFLLETTMI